MGTDSVEAPKRNLWNPNRIYKSAIKGVLSNKTKRDYKTRKSIFDRIEGRSWIKDALRGDSLSTRRQDSQRWDHDLFNSMVSTEPGSMIYVRNLPNDITGDELKLYFESIDPVVSIKIEKGRLIAAHVGFMNRDAAERACKYCHQKDINGKVIRVAISEMSNKVAGENTNRVSIFDRMLK